eukprot:6259256-Amphidinium_carterae.2
MEPLCQQEYEFRVTSLKLTLPCGPCHSQLLDHAGSMFPGKDLCERFPNCNNHLPRIRIPNERQKLTKDNKYCHRIDKYS